MKIQFRKTIFIGIALAVLASSCDTKNKTLNIFSVQDDINFGQQFDEQIRASGEYQLLSETEYAEAYSILYQYRDRLLATGEVKYADKFVWKVSIIKDDATVNAFCVPGGYLYVYTGLIKSLESEAEFLGVMAHEMGHAASRHSTKQLTKAYGLELMVSMLLGKNPNQWMQIASGLAVGLTELKFSRDDELQADKCAVIYTYNTNHWDARGVSYFFERMDSHTSTPVFLSTHPSDKERVKKVNEEWTKLGGNPGQKFQDEYNNFKSKLRL